MSLSSQHPVAVHELEGERGEPDRSEDNALAAPLPLAFAVRGRALPAFQIVLGASKLRLHKGNLQIRQLQT
jgi:hypothetical protein